MIGYRHGNGGALLLKMQNFFGSDCILLSKNNEDKLLCFGGAKKRGDTLLLQPCSVTRLPCRLL